MICYLLKDLYLTKSVWITVMFENCWWCEIDQQFSENIKRFMKLGCVIEYWDICSFNISETPEEEKMVVEPKVV